MTDSLELIKKIHEGIDDTCFGAILKHWCKRDFNESLLAKLRIDNEWHWKNIMMEDDISCCSEVDMYDILFSGYQFFDQLEWISTQEAEDAYFSLNSFWNENKTTNDVRHLNAFVMDLDFYKIKKFEQMTPEAFYEKYISKKLSLKPTAVINSGRGLYVIYAFKHCSYHMTSLYNSITKNLYKDFNRFGMDPKAMNITQVIRIPGSVNTKTGEMVEVIEYNDTTYTIQDIAAAVLPYNKEQMQEMKKENKKKETVKTTITSLQKNIDGRKRHFSTFFADLQKLIQLRNYDIEGLREYILYITRERAEWSGYTEDESILFAMKLNEMLKDPLDARDITKQCKPSRRPHKTSLNKIMLNLKISADEMESMKMLRSRAMKLAARQKQRRKHPLLNRTEAECKRMDRRKQVLYLKITEKLSNAAIAQKLDIDRKTVTNDLRYIKANPAQFLKRLETYLSELDDYTRTQIFRQKELYTEQVSIIENLRIGFDLIAKWRRYSSFEFG